MIKFGTDGWRDVIAANYTFENVSYVSRGSAEYFKTLENVSNGILIGYDGRFLSREFAEQAARVIANEGVLVYIASTVVTTPGTSLAVLRKKLAAGVMITASHNPARYNGFKLKGSYGGAALPEAIAKVEKITNSKANQKAVDAASGALPSFAELVKAKKIKELDVRGLYLRELQKLLDLDAIDNAKFEIAYDPMYGSGVNHMEELVPSAGILHNIWNPGFGGTPPEPLPQNTEDFARFVTSNKYGLGLVTDGDADRIGAIDEKGNFFSSQMIICLLVQYLVEVRKQKGRVVVSQSVTSMIEPMCKEYGLELVRTPVGFKYITEYMLQGNVMIGGEESGGIGIPSIHIPERDGIFNGLLLAEICAQSGKTLGRLVADLEKKYGPHRYSRFDFHTNHERMAQVLGKAEAGFDKIAGKKVLHESRVDGFKYELEGGAWLMIRTSGTEPLLRYYAEAPDDATVEKLLAFAKKL